MRRQGGARKRVHDRERASERAKEWRAQGEGRAREQGTGWQEWGAQGELARVGQAGN